MNITGGTPGLFDAKASPSGSFYFTINPNPKSNVISGSVIDSMSVRFDASRSWTGDTGFL